MSYTGRIQPDEILALLDEMKKDRHPLINEAQKVADVFDGKIMLPLPEIDKVDVPAVANLTFQGVDAGGQQIGSQVPYASFLPTADTGAARERARTKRGAVDYWWLESGLPLKFGQLGRWFTAYGAAGVMVKPGQKKDCPLYLPLDPLRTFPSGYDVCCEFAISVRRQNRRWVKRQYPDSTLPGGIDAKPTDVIELIEYVDEYEFVILARETAHVMVPSGFHNMQPVVLTRFRNPIDRCPVFMSGRPGLSGPKSQFSGIIGLYIQRAAIGAYRMIGIRRSVMPEKWAFNRDSNMTPDVQQVADAITGEIGIVTGGEITQLLPQPSQMAMMEEDRLERAERVQARLPAEYGGESASNVRTDRRGQTIFSATVDLSVKEAHDHFAVLLHEANKAAIAADKAYYGGTSKTIYFTKIGIERSISYDPKDLWDSDRHTVVYSQPGTDSAGLALEAGQRVGMGTLSKREFMEMDPFVKDPELTHDLIQYERLADALLNGLDARVQAGQLPEVDLARIMQRVKDDRSELEDAVVQQQQEAQARQAAMAPPTAPEAQPGMANPGAGAEVAPAIRPPAESEQNLGHLGRLIRSLNFSG